MTSSSATFTTANTSKRSWKRYHVLTHLPRRGSASSDVKPQDEPAPCSHITGPDRAMVDQSATSHARRTIIGQRAMAAQPDVHLGWVALEDGALQRS